VRLFVALHKKRPYFNQSEEEISYPGYARQPIELHAMSRRDKVLFSKCRGPAEPHTVAFYTIGFPDGTIITHGKVEPVQIGPVIALPLERLEEVFIMLKRVPIIYRAVVAVEV
jgi:hypothetical protein